MKTYLTLEKSIIHKSNYDGSLYKSYVTSFFSYTKAHHTINDFYDEKGNVYIPEAYSFCEKKRDAETNEIFVRAEVEFEDDLDMDFLLHKPLYFEEPDWFHDLSNEKINKIECSYSDWDILGPVYRTINISISNDGTIQIKDIKENQDPLISTCQIEESNIQQFFEAMKLNLGSETTYDPRYVGGWSRRFTLYCEKVNVFEYHGNYCTDHDENSLTTNIVEELFTKCQIII